MIVNLPEPTYICLSSKNALINLNIPLLPILLIFINKPYLHIILSDSSSSEIPLYFLFDCTFLFPLFKKSNQINSFSLSKTYVICQLSASSSVIVVVVQVYFEEIINLSLQSKVNQQTFSTTRNRNRKQRKC